MQDRHDQPRNLPNEASTGNRRGRERERVGARKVIEVEENNGVELNNNVHHRIKYLELLHR